MVGKSKNIKFNTCDTDQPTQLMRETSKKDSKNSGDIIPIRHKHLLIVGRLTNPLSQRYPVKHIIKLEDMNKYKSILFPSLLFLFNFPMNDFLNTKFNTQKVIH